MKVKKRECNFEREEGISKRSHNMFAAFLHEFWRWAAVHSPPHPPLVWSCSEQGFLQPGQLSAHPCNREGDAVEQEK